MLKYTNKIQLNFCDESEINVTRDAMCVRGLALGTLGYKTVDEEA